MVLINNIVFQHLSIISFIHLIAWCYCLKLKGWVIDDQAGIAAFSDRFIQEKDAKGNVTKEYAIREYDVDLKDKDGKPYKVKVKNTAWNKYLPFPDNFMRWFRLNWGRSFKEIGKDSKGHTHYGWVQNSGKHHALNIIVQWANLLLGYNLLSHLFGSELAFLSMLIFAVHPCGVQTVGWISGVNYLMSLLGSLIVFNSCLYIENPYILLPVVAAASVFSCMTLLSGCFNFVILLLMGHINPAIVSAIVGGIFLLKLGKKTVDFRVAAFKEQQMGKSTKVYWRKSIVAVKTFWYYVRLVLFPKRLGLFHIENYHQEEKYDYVDKDFWFGFASILIYIAAIIYSPFPIKFGLIWGLIYYAIFCNIITANQFVSERYIHVPLFGLSIVFAYFLKDYPIFLSFLLGIYIMRVWVHLPTFQNEVRYYESNCFNFPDSEVAMGNLGVAYLNHGMAHKAFDTWHEGTRQNALYDVPWYNLYSICKQNGDLLGARRFLMMCLNAKTIHFPDQWSKELKEVDRLITTHRSLSDHMFEINKRIMEAGYVTR